MSISIEKLNTLYDFLCENIRGQQHALKNITNMIQCGELGLVSKNEPKGSAILFGPTGVGKTETCMKLSEFLFNDRNALVRFDMSEFMNQTTAELFIDRMQYFIEPIEPQGGIILFDEMEKANYRILDFFLQILSAARLTCKNHKTLNLERFYIFFTSNLGSEIIADIQSDKFPFSAIEKAVLRKAEAELRPEFFGRIKVKVVYNKLPPPIQREIANMYLEKEIKQWNLAGYTPDVLEHVIRKGIHVKYGARPLKTTIESNVRTALKDAILNGTNIINRSISKNEKTDKLSVI